MSNYYPTTTRDREEREKLEREAQKERALEAYERTLIETSQANKRSSKAHRKLAKANQSLEKAKQTAKKNGKNECSEDVVLAYANWREAMDAVRFMGQQNIADSIKTFDNYRKKSMVVVNNKHYYKADTLYGMYRVSMHVVKMCSQNYRTNTMRITHNSMGRNILLTYVLEYGNGVWYMDKDIPVHGLIQLVSTMDGYAQDLVQEGVSCIVDNMGSDIVALYDQVTQVVQEKIKRDAKSGTSYDNDGTMNNKNLSFVDDRVTIECRDGKQYSYSEFCDLAFSGKPVYSCEYATKTFLALHIDSRLYADSELCKAFGQLCKAFSVLKDRPKEVIKLSFKGLRNKDIAEKLGISPSSVSNAFLDAEVKLHKYAESNECSELLRLLDSTKIGRKRERQEVVVCERVTMTAHWNESNPMDTMHYTFHTDKESYYKYTYNEKRLTSAERKAKSRAEK